MQSVRGKSADDVQTRDFKREPSTHKPSYPVALNERYPALSGLHGLAALGVFAVHAYALMGSPSIWPDHPAASLLLAWPLKMGSAGVDVFFTLATFLLALPFAHANLAQTSAVNLHGYAACCCFRWRSRRCRGC